MVCAVVSKFLGQRSMHSVYQAISSRSSKGAGNEAMYLHNVPCTYLTCNHLLM